MLYTQYMLKPPSSIYLSIFPETIYLSKPSAIFTQIKHIHPHNLFFKYFSTTSHDSLFINIKLQYSTVQSLINKWNKLEFCHKKKEKIKSRKNSRNHKKTGKFIISWKRQNKINKKTRFKFKCTFNLHTK